MKKLTLISCLLLLSAKAVWARHIKGGEISYQYVGTGSAPNTDRYIITLRLFLECNAAGQQLDETANIGIYRNVDQMPVQGSPFNFPLVNDEYINIRQPNPCIVNPSPVCYRLRVYVSTLDLPRDAGGHTAVFQRCCRIENLSNLSPNNNIGSSYTCNIHSFDAIPPGEKNSSPAFAIKDTVLICQNRPFQLDFGAADLDGDSLSYEFIDALNAPGGGGGGVLNPMPPNSIGFVNYASGFSGRNPLGSTVTINPGNGLISGIAPRGGDYVLSVMVREWRHGKMISEHRKDFNLKVDERCDLAAALLKPTYSSCEDFTFNFKNEAPASSLIKTYNWYFSDGGSAAVASPPYTFKDTGVYLVKLVVNQGDQCSDSATSRIAVFPGFSPGFEIVGSCYQNPFLFRDTTTAKYGSVNSWSWQFGDEAATDDSSRAQSPNWKYSRSGQKQINFKVSTDKGCEADLSHVLDVRDKPLVNLAFRDTLLCDLDSLRLRINGSGNYTWTPSYNIIDGGSPNPLVYPKTTTWYKVFLDDNGCVNSDSVLVRVVSEVTLNASPDTTICLTDSALIYASGDALRYRWDNAATLSNPNIRNPFARPTGTTMYTVTGSIGSCVKSELVQVLTVPYPFADAGRDTTVCFDDSATLHATIKGNQYAWSPSSSLLDGNTLDPIAFPRRSTTYTLTVYDNLGCPKPGIARVLVNVKDKINAFAGNDTSIVAGQPLLLRGSGSDLYDWSPSLYMTRSNISNPVITLNDNMSYIMKSYTEEGCFAYDTINIKVFKTAPDIFVPNAFTPLGKNRVFRPIPVGMREFKFFRVFNRYGQLVFETSEVGHGWDGTVGGKLQPTGTYVWMVGGTDYLGKPLTKRGTALLIK